MSRRSSSAEQWIVRTICAIALLLVAFAHKPIVLDRPLVSASELSQYVLPDGTVPVLCLTSEDGATKHAGRDLWSGCEACRLTASILLPVRADVAGLPIVHQVRSFLPKPVKAFRRQLFTLNTAPRGPPRDV